MPKVNLNISSKVFNPVYLPILNNQDRYLILYGGAGSGKSVVIAQKKLIRVMKEPGHRILVVRKVATTLRESVFALIKSTIIKWKVSHLFSINKTDMTITCANGNQILFTGLDDVEKLKSIADISSIWIEEASEIDQGDFEQLNLRLRGNMPNYKQICISFNPINAMHWLKSWFFDREVPSTTILRTTFLDNKFIDDDYKSVLLAMKDTNPNGYKVYCLGEWGVYEGQFFNMWDTDKHVCKPFPIPKEWPRIRSIDWGSYRPYAVGWYAIDYDGRAWKYRELYGYGGKANLGTKETAQQVAKKIRAIEKAAGEENVYGIADPACWIKTGSSGPSIAEDFSLEGVGVSKADNDRRQGWEQMKTRLIGIDGKPWLIHFDTCVHSIRTIPILTHDEHKVEDLDSDLEDHNADEERYFCMSRPWKPIHVKPDKPRDYNGYKRDSEEDNGSWMAG